jgi:DNA-binding CsgD family transcriptional regulator
MSIDDLLTDRQRQLVALLILGISYKEIGKRLGIAEGTVKVHMQDIFNKVGVRNRHQIVAIVTGYRTLPEGGGDARSLSER